MRLIAFLLLLLIVSSCTQRAQDESVQSNNSQSNLVKYASHLQIFEDNNGFRVVITDPKTGKARFKGFFASPETKTPRGYQLVEIPVAKLSPLSSTLTGMLVKLDRSSICAVSSAKYLYDQKLLEGLKKHTITELGDEGLIPTERIIASGTKVLLFSDFGQDFPNQAQLQLSGITCIPTPDWREDHPLGKAEWIKFMGILTGKFERSVEIFEKTEKEYKRLTILAEKAKSQPTVISGNMINDIWYAPAGDSYNAILLKDANADYIYRKSKGTGSIERTLEQIVSATEGVSFWINPGFPTRQAILSNCNKLEYSELYHTSRIWCYSHDMARFWEQSAVEPHKVLEDLIRLLHPELAMKGSFHFYREIK